MLVNIALAITVLCSSVNMFWPLKAQLPQLIWRRVTLQALKTTFVRRMKAFVMCKKFP